MPGTIFKRLPDINSYPEFEKTGLRAYGRFAILNDGSFWFGDLQSSHPRDTKAGWYWAVDSARNVLISARGAELDNDIIRDPKTRVLKWLIGELSRRGLIITAASPKA